jgi:transcriptional/translational regulatory protein YebC/TACO1
MIVLDGNEYSEDDVMMAAMELPILDFKNDDGALIIETEPGNMLEVKKGLEEAGFTNFLTSEVSKVATSKVALDDEKATKLQNLIDALEDDDDVSEVHTNVE